MQLSIRTLLTVAVVSCLMWAGIGYGISHAQVVNFLNSSNVPTPVKSGTSPLPVTGTITVGVLSVTTVDKAGAITTGGTAQTAIAANASRTYWCIANPASATTQGIATAESLFVRIGTTATTTTGNELTPGAQVCSPVNQIDTRLVSVIAATTNHKWYGSEMQ